PALGDHSGRIEVEHAHLARQYHEPVGRTPPPTRAQPVAVEYAADDRTVGEGDTGRTVPRLHQARVELVEGAPVAIHRRVVLPRLRNHNQYAVRQASTTEVQQLQHLVEGGRVGGAGRTDGVEPAQVAGDQVGLEQRLAGVHPVAVAPDGVDLS